MRSSFLRLLPEKMVYGDRMTTSGRRLVFRLLVGAVLVVLAGVGVGLLDATNWRDVTAGALFAWSVSGMVWAVGSFRKAGDETRIDLRRVAELDLLHGRLNQFAARVDLPMLDLQGQIEMVLREREERLAHFAGLDEFRPDLEAGSTGWWDAETLGMHADVP